MIIAITILTIFTLIACQGLQMVNTYQHRSVLLRTAAVEGVNAIETMKIQKNYLDLHGVTIQKGNIEIYHEVTEFTPEIYKILIKVRDLCHNEILSLETLAEK
jgi:hypothetical protein